MKNIQKQLLDSPLINVCVQIINFIEIIKNITSEYINPFKMNFVESIK